MIRALLLAQLLALAAFAQSDAEFARGSGGVVLGAIAKAPQQLSGSFRLSNSTGVFSGRGYGATVGGQIVRDRLWFFGTASVQPQMRLTNSSLITPSAKVTAQRADSDVFPLPKSFLSLHSTTMLSDRMALDISFAHH